MFTDPYLGNITVFAGNFAPVAYMFCQGQLLPISQYDALFALIGTNFGGDGQTTFALPDLRGRTANHQGQGPGMQNYVVGQMSGSENVTLVNANLANHNHGVASLTGTPRASTDTTGSAAPVPGSSVPASGASLYNTEGNAGSMETYSSTAAVPIAGSSMPIPIVSPVMAMNFIIAVEGIFPSRN